MIIIIINIIIVIIIVKHAEKLAIVDFIFSADELSAIVIS